MTLYTYTQDFPNEDINLNLRLGYRTPREILLPPYLFGNDYFRDFMDSVDEVFESMVDTKTEILGGLRNMWVTNPAMENSLYDNPAQLVPFESWSQPERDLLVKQVNMLGMKLRSAGIISNDGYQAIARWVGMYWFGKGTEAFIDFINYSLSTSLAVVKLWTNDYVNFLPDGDPGIGTPIWEGGDWYPTTTVNIVAAGGLTNIDIPTLVNFFYEIANYNLVLQAITITYDMWITDDPNLIRTDAEVVAVGLWLNESIVISNFAQYGANPPETFNTAPEFTASAYVPSQTIGSGTFLLAQPTSWIEQNGKIFPVYGQADMAIKNGPELPMSLMGGPSQNGQTNGFFVLYGPVTWLEVPGSSRSTARIPGYATVPVAKTVALSSIPTQTVGAVRANLLTNPDGWLDFDGSGFVTPYWNATT
jgi:hypothetical protein